MVSTIRAQAGSFQRLTKVYSVNLLHTFAFYQKILEIVSFNRPSSLSTAGSVQPWSSMAMTIVPTATVSRPSVRPNSPAYSGTDSWGFRPYLQIARGVKVGMSGHGAQSPAICRRIGLFSGWFKWSMNCSIIVHRCIRQNACYNLPRLPNSSSASSLPQGQCA